MKQPVMKPVFGGFYLISDDGRLYSVRSGKFLKPDFDRYGYIYYVVSINGIRSTAKAHRLVAQAFIPNPQNKPTVNHKNGIRTDNTVCNLEWATTLEQARDPLTYAKTLAVSKMTDYAAMGAIRNFGRKRVAVYGDHQLLGTYDSLLEAARAHKANYSKASECANGIRETAGGVRFAYIG